MTNLSWDEYFFGMAKYVSTKSKDRSTKVGCVVVGPSHEIRTTGYNGFPRYMNDDNDHRHERPAKYLYTEHAERNAIYNAARNGIKLDGCTMYITSFPCADCVRGIIQTGIDKVVTPDFSNQTTRIPLENYEVAKEMLYEAGVIVENTHENFTS